MGRCGSGGVPRAGLFTLGWALLVWWFGKKAGTEGGGVMEFVSSHLCVRVVFAVCVICLVCSPLWLSVCVGYVCLMSLYVSWLCVFCACMAMGIVCVYVCVCVFTCV